LLETEAQAIANGEAPHLVRSPPHYDGRRCKKGKALMVAAPTNKAVSVLASRFMKTISGEAPGTTPCHELKVILVGDHEKLVEDTPIYSNGHGNASVPEGVVVDDSPSLKETIKSMACLKRIFVYRFLNNLEEELKNVLETHVEREDSIIDNSQESDDSDDTDSTTSSVSLEDRNYKTQRYSLLRLLHQYIDIGYLFKEGFQSRAEKLRDTLLKMAQKDLGKTKPKAETDEEIRKRREKFKRQLEKLADDVKALLLNHKMGHRVTLALVRSADLIFCTLAASGASIFKSRDRPFKIRDLIVDEASAASELYLYQHES
jgi:AAA domain